MITATQKFNLKNAIKEEIETKAFKRGYRKGDFKEK